MSLPARAESTADRKQAQRGPVPGRRPGKERRNGVTDRTDTWLLVYWAPAAAPAQASQSPNGGLGLHSAARRPPALLTVSIAGGAGWLRSL